VDTTDPILPGDPEAEPVVPTPTRPSSRPWAIAAVVVSLVLLTAGVIARYVQLPYDSLAPGGAEPVNSVVMVKGHDVYVPKGKVFYVTVSVRERINPYEALAGWLDPTVQVIPETQVRGTIPPDQYQKINVEAMADSKTGPRSSRSRPASPRRPC
jgi:PDZ domain-containing secreted protein